MPSTRSSARHTGPDQPSSDAAKSSPGNNNGAGQKRKADSSPAQPKEKVPGRKRGRPKKQKTIEETMPDSDVGDEKNEDDESEMKEGGVEDSEMKDAAEGVEEEQKEKDDKDEGECNFSWSAHRNLF